MRIEWMRVDKGSFKMGLSKQMSDALKAKAKKEKTYTTNWEEEELQQKKIHLDTFYISRYPITNENFLEFMKSDWFDGFNPSWYQNFEEDAKEAPDHPYDASWFEAMAFCGWIHARLPTSAEWEKAARGIDGRLYPWGNEWDETRLKICGTGSVLDHPSGKSPYGVEDMMGNGYEHTMTVRFERMVGGYKGEHVCRGWHDGKTDDYDSSAIWAQNRVTTISYGKHGDCIVLVAFRPVMDLEHFENIYFPGVDLRKYWQADKLVREFPRNKLPSMSSVCDRAPGCFLIVIPRLF